MDRRPLEDMMWDPEQYQRYGDERSRPFYDLLARIRVRAPRLVYDLGCGPGVLTASLAERWPSARVVGIDNDPAMLASAAAHASGRVSFRHGDLATFLPPPEADIVVSNAAYHWVDSHTEVLGRIATRLPEHGALAIQVPGNFSAPSHTVVRELLAEPPWERRLPNVRQRVDPVHTAIEYGELFARHGLSVDTWETTYNQVLTGDDPVLEWVKGTVLRPVLNALGEGQQAELLAELGPRLRAAYPRTQAGVVFGFRRIFAVGHR